jgi:integrase
MLTVPGIRKLKGVNKKGKPTRVYKHDGGGLYLVIQPKPSNAKSWYSIWREAADAKGRRKPGKLYLGSYTEVEVSGEPVIGSALTPKQARILHNVEQRKRASGIDVVAERRQEKIRRQLVAADAERALYPKAVADYIAFKKAEGFRTADRIAAALGLAKDGAVIKQGLADRWRARRVDSITREEIQVIAREAYQTAIPGLGNTGGKSDARERRILDALGGLFKWLSKSRNGGYANPVLGIERPGWKDRKRTLTDAEIVAVWNATEEWTPFNRIVRTLLLTGQRLSEVAKMHAEELAGDVWTIPCERTKNKEAHKVPLSPEVLKLLRVNTAFIFEGKLAGRPYSGFSKGKALLDTKLKFANPWRLHDIRRSFVTGIIDKGIALPHIVEAIVNHKTGHKRGVAGIYNRAEYVEQKRAALDAWANHIVGLVAAANKAKKSADKRIKKLLQDAHA